MKHRILNLILAIEIVFAADLLLLFNQHKPSVALFYVCLAALWLLLCRFVRLPFKKHCLVPFLLPALIALFVYAPWRVIGSNAHYASVDTGKADVFSGKKVMLIVPHEDDDINVAGGILEQYAQYGSEVYVVFVTNGDYYGLGETRIAEGIAACGYMGVPEDHVIFLGYGDQWKEGGVHLYNAQPGQVMVSYAGNTQTYGTPSHPAYRMGREYTVDNMLEDLESVIVEHQPDTLICSDFDLHVDHKSVTLSFEKVMGRILDAHPDYQPVVLKGYAYFPAWTARSDFYALNILSTENIFVAPFNQTPEVYEWENRVRLPVAADTLSRSLVHSRAYTALQVYKSQYADQHASCIVNGDKVFWQRRTDSLLYHASVSASSGDAGLLNNFMLIDSHNILDRQHLPGDGTWIPDDAEKTVSVSFAQPTDVHEIVLYDHPSMQDNVLNAEITFDSGAVFETGRLMPGGSASSFAVNQTGVSSLTITLKETEGGSAGLTEIEAYDVPYVSPFSMIKLTNRDGHFVYDYIIDRSGSEQFDLYTFGDGLPALAEGAYTVSCDNAKCSARIANSKLEVVCPTGESCTLTVQSKENPELCDSVVIRSPGAIGRLALQGMQKAEAFVHGVYSNNYLHKTVFARTPDALAEAVPQAIDSMHHFLYRLKVMVLGVIGLA